MESFLDELLYRKALNTIIVTTVLFYTECLLNKAQHHESNNLPFFINNHVALERMEEDVRLMKAFFNSLAESMPSLGNIIEREFQFLEVIQELMRIAARLSDSDARSFIMMLHKRVKDVKITKRVVGDLWHLVRPKKEKGIRNLTRSMNEALDTLCPQQNHEIDYDVPELRIDEALAKFYKQKKKRCLSPVRHLNGGKLLPNKSTRRRILKRLKKSEITHLLNKLSVK